MSPFPSELEIGSNLSRGVRHCQLNEVCLQKAQRHTKNKSCVWIKIGQVSWPLLLIKPNVANQVND